MDGVLFHTLVVVGEVILRRVLKGDPSASAPWSLELAFEVISTPALATTMMTTTPSPPPPPHKVNQCKNPLPPVLIVFVIGYLFFIYELPCGNQLNIP